jgi:hypothetical protein
VSAGGASSSGVGGAGGSAPATLPAIKNQGQGWQIYPGGGYRYGPSILVHPDKSIDMFTCSPGENGAWDFIRHRHSADGGHTWTPDIVAIQPTPGSRDALSTCDPGAVMINGYYYVGYGSTENPMGTANQVYLARSKSPDGPYEKWSGSGWGNAPQPIVTYSGDPTKYGAGEPSLVLVGKKLYVYSTNNGDDGEFTDCATVDDATVDDWPSKLVSHGHVIARRVNGNEDSTDVKYVDALQKFVGVATYARFSVNSTVGVYQSTDGITFEPVPFRGARVQAGAHNIGLSGDESGHLPPSIPAFIAYAYWPVGSSWGDWPTWMDPVSFEMVPAGTPVGGAVSSNLPGGAGWDWSGPKVWDGDPNTVFSSDSHADAKADEAVLIDLGKTYMVKGVVITPRAGGLAFPTDFTLRSGTDAADLVDLPGEAFAGFATPSSDVTLVFQSPMMARYLQLAANGLGVDDQGNHYLQLAEMAPILE